MDTIPPIGQGPDAPDGSFESLSGEPTPAGQAADPRAVVYSESGEFVVDPWNMPTGPINIDSTTQASASVAPIADRIAEAAFSASPLSDVEIAQETTSLYRAEIADLRKLYRNLKKLQTGLENNWANMSPADIIAADTQATNERFALKAQINMLMSIVIPDILSSLEKARIVTFFYNSKLNAITCEPIPIQFGKENSLLTVSRIGNNGNEYEIKRPQETPNDTSRNSLYLHADDKSGALLFASYRKNLDAPQDILHLVGPNIDEATNNANLIKMALCVKQVAEALIEKLESARDEKR